MSFVSEAVSPNMPLETPDDRSIGGIDGDLAHFAIASEDCQPIDQATRFVTKPCPHQLTTHALAQHLPRGRERNCFPGSNGSALLDAGEAARLLLRDRRQG